MAINAGPATVAPPPVRRHLLAALVGGLSLSRLGDQMYLLAMPLLVVRIAHAPAAMGVQYALEYLPFLGLPLIGALVDRWDRGTLLVGADIVRIALLVALPFVSRVPGALWAMYATGFAVTVAAEFFETGLDALMPLWADDKALGRLNTVFATSGALSGFLVAAPEAPVAAAAMTLQQTLTPRAMLGRVLATSRWVAWLSLRSHHCSPELSDRPSARACSWWPPAPCLWRPGSSGGAPSCPAEPVHRWDLEEANKADKHRQHRTHADSRDWNAIKATQAPGCYALNGVVRPCASVIAAVPAREAWPHRASRPRTRMR